MITKKELKSKLLQIKDVSFLLRINDYILLNFFYDEKDNAIGVSNIDYYSPADWYEFNEKSIDELVNLTFENNHELQGA